MASHSLTSLITLSIALYALPALAQPKAAPPAQDALKEHFIAEHEIGRRFSLDPAQLPAPKSSPIVTNRALTLPAEGHVPQVPAGFTATLFASGLANPRRLLVLPNGDVLVAEQSAGYLTLLRDEGDGTATWINRHVEDLNRPYGLAWRNDHVLVADQDAIWRVPHTLGAVRAGRPTPAQRARRASSAFRQGTRIGTSRSIHRPGPSSWGSARPAISASSPSRKPQFNASMLTAGTRRPTRRECATRRASPFTRRRANSGPSCRSVTGSATICPPTT